MNYISKKNTGLTHIDKWLGIDLKDRKLKRDKLKELYPKYSSIIMVPSRNSDPELKKYKYIVPSDTPIWKFRNNTYNLVKQSSTKSNTSIVIFIKNIIPNSASSLSDMEKYAGEDGFIYIKYATESTFG